MGDMTTPEAPSMSATRTWHGRKAVVTVRIEHGLNRTLVTNLGGKRAERAAAAIVWLHPNSQSPETPKVVGLRADLDAAVVEARRLETATTMRQQGYVHQVTPATWAVAVPVVEGV